MGKLSKEFKRVKNQVVDAVKAVEPAIRHTIQKIDVRLELDPHRDAARGALESAEKELAEMNAVFALAQSIELEIKNRLEVEGAVVSEDDQKIVSEQVSIIRSGVQKLSETQVKVAAEKEIVSTERGKVSSILNEVENPDSAKQQAKDACSKALSAARAIKDMLAQAQNELRNIQAAQQEIITIIQAAGKDVKDTKETEDTQGQSKDKDVWTGSEEGELDVVQSAGENLPVVPQEPLNVPGYPIPLAQPANQAQPLVGQGQLVINNEPDPVEQVLRAEAADVDAFAPPHYVAGNVVTDLPPAYAEDPAVVVHIEHKEQAEDPQAAQIRQLQEEMAAMQRQQAEQMAVMHQRFAALLVQQGGAGAASSSPSPVVTPLRDLHAEPVALNIQGDNNVPAAPASPQQRASAVQYPF